MLIRDATPDEAEALAELHHAAVLAAYASIYGPGWTPRPMTQRLSWWQQNLEPGSGVDALVCADGDAIVGFACVGPNRDGLDASVGELYALYVQPEHLGKGLGHQLLAAAEQRLAARGFVTATLWTLEPNDRARRFYEHRGWQADGASMPDETDPEIREVRYAKPLVD
jgi:GNAT superfamily N-acetyltransferase